MNSINSTNANISNRGIMDIEKSNKRLGGNQNIQESASGLSVDDFLQIMAAEISNPSFGGEGGNTDYISQLAQFTTLEQLGQMSESLDLLAVMGQQQYAFSLIGKEVTVNTGEVIEGSDPKEYVKITGIAEKVKFENGMAVIEVEGETYYIGAIEEVARPNKEIEEISPEPEEIEKEEIEIDDNLQPKTTDIYENASYNVRNMKLNKLSEDIEV